MRNLIPFAALAAIIAGCAAIPGASTDTMTRNAHSVTIGNSTAFSAPDESWEPQYQLETLHYIPATALFLDFTDDELIVYRAGTDSAYHDPVKVALGSHAGLYPQRVIWRTGSTEARVMWAPK